MHEAACYIGNFAGKDTLTWLIYAQHYGAPTRLLDWTSNPLVALYFACKDVSKDGYVAVLNINKFNRFKAEALKQQIDKENMGLTIKELIEKSLLDRDCYEYPIVHLPQYIDSRMSAQSSYFLAWGRDKRSLEDMLFQHKNKSKAFSGDNRYILFKIMIDKDLKLNLLKITIDNELQNKVKRVIQAKGNDDNKEIERLKKFFYSMEFYDIQQMLFKPHWTELDEKARNNFLEKHEDLSNLSDHELREIISNIGPKSDWERFFSDKTDKAEFESFLDVIRESRNKVAHCKFFYKLDYFDCNKTIRKFNKVIKDAIYLTEDKEFIKKNSESIKEALSGVMKGLEEYKRFMENISKSAVMLLYYE